MAGNHSAHTMPDGSPPSHQVSPIDRHGSPSPALHPGMPTLPPPIGTHSSPYQTTSRLNTPSASRQDVYNDGSRYGTAGPSTPAAGAGAGFGSAAMMHDPMSTPYDYGHSYPDHGEYNYDGAFDPDPHGMHSHHSYASDLPLSAAAGHPASGTPTWTDSESSHFQDYSPSLGRQSLPYLNPQMATSRSHNHMANAAFVDPSAILDDGDDFSLPRKRSSKVLAFNRSKTNLQAMPAIGAGALDVDVVGRDSSGNYGPVPANHSVAAFSTEKSPWIEAKVTRRKKAKKLIFIGIGLLIVAGIIAGAVSGVVTREGNNSRPSSSSSSTSSDSSSDLSLNSPEIKKIMNNPDLHKVFSGFAYTPMNTQYPGCMSLKPTQNNVTKDMAVMGQLTNVIRLYGTDCNQTEMVLHAIDRLQLKDMKVWLGVWLGNNATTNTRQVAQMWNILDKYGVDKLKGIVVGNEVLFRKDLTFSQLSTFISETKKNLTAKGYNLPVATSDLGSNWSSQLAQIVDVTMANVHPFFGGVPIDQAASWTYTFWQENDVVYTKGMPGKSNIISEFGWPSEGGNDCGAGANCPDSTSGSVASIQNIQKLMDTWICQALSNGTDYFWFSAFDEPWKIIFNEGKAQWEDKWGIMDVNRNMKKGLSIPSCNGNTTSPG